MTTKPTTPRTTRQRKPHGDLTGQKLQEAQAEKAAEQRDASERMTMANPPEPDPEVIGGDPIDIEDARVDHSPPPAPPITDGRVDSPETQVVEVEPEPVEVDGKVTITMNETVTEMTYGAGNIYTFLAGRQYKVTPDLRDHLNERGLIW